MSKAKIIYVQKCEHCLHDSPVMKETGQWETGVHEVVVDEHLLLNEILDITLRYGTSPSTDPDYSPDNAEDWPEWFSTIMDPVFDRLREIEDMEEDVLRQAEKFLRQEGDDA